MGRRNNNKRRHFYKSCFPWGESGEGGLSVKRMLISRDCDIWRMGSLQSDFGFDAEVICIIFSMGDMGFQSCESAS